MTTPDQRQFHQHIVLRDKIDYTPVDAPEDKELALNYSSDSNTDKHQVESSDGLMKRAEARNFELEAGIDYDAVEELVGDINQLRNGLLVLLLLFITFAGFIALDDYRDYKKMLKYDEKENALLLEDSGKPPHPHMGHKLQINASAFTVNDFECLQLDTGNWPSERVHCELRPSNDGDDLARYDFVVEHFDDEHCQEPNAEIPIVRHTASGCYFFEGYNHSYNDVCHTNRTLTVSAFYGPGCLNPMPVTAVNILPEDGQDGN